MNISTRSGSGILVAVAAALAIAGCGGSKNDELPLIPATVSVKTVSAMKTPYAPLPLMTLQAPSHGVEERTPPIWVCEASGKYQKQQSIVLPKL